MKMLNEQESQTHALLKIRLPTLSSQVMLSDDSSQQVAGQNSFGHCTFSLLQGEQILLLSPFTKIQKIAMNFENRCLGVSK